MAHGKVCNAKLSGGINFFRGNSIWSLEWTPGDCAEVSRKIVFVSIPVKYGSSLVGIKSYTYDKLVLDYGPLKENTVAVSWNASKSKYDIAFGGIRSCAGMSPHAMIKDQIGSALNSNHNLALMSKVLDETFHACLSLSRLPSTPQFVSGQSIAFRGALLFDWGFLIAGLLF